MNDWNERALNAAKALHEEFGTDCPCARCGMTRNAAQVLLDGTASTGYAGEEMDLPDSEGPWWMWVAFKLGGQWRLTWLFYRTARTKPGQKLVWIYPGETVGRQIHIGRWRKISQPADP